MTSKPAGVYPALILRQLPGKYRPNQKPQNIIVAHFNFRHFPKQIFYGARKNFFLAAGRWIWKVNILYSKLQQPSIPGHVFNQLA